MQKAFRRLWLTDPLNQIRKHRESLKSLFLIISAKAKSEMVLPTKDLYTSLLPNGVNPCDIHRRLTKFLIILYQQRYCQLEQKGTEWNKRRLLDPQNSRGVIQLIKLLSCKHVLLFIKRKRHVDRRGRRENLKAE